MINKDGVLIPDDAVSENEEAVDEEAEIAEQGQGTIELFEYPTIPLRGVSIFPGTVAHFDVGREKSVKALEKAMLNNQEIFLISQIDAEVEDPGKDDYYWVGTISEIKQMLRLPGGLVRVLVEGVCKAVIADFIENDEYIDCLVEKRPDLPIEDTEEALTEYEALGRTLYETFEEYIDVEGKIPPEVISMMDGVGEPGDMADMIISHMPLDIPKKQSVLEIFNPAEKIKKVIEILNDEIEILKIEGEIGEKVKKSMTKNQREYYLREQMRAIQEELGQEENVELEVSEYLEKLAALKLPEKIHAKIETEIKRLYKVQLASAEGGVVRTYADWVLGLPWNKLSEDITDIGESERILNEDHYGLEKVKERIVEYLAVKQLAGGLKGPIICLVGPPGVGKTSIAKSIARAMGRTFTRMSLGGMRDEAEIRGHRRTYIGSMPGRIITGIRDAETANPVFLLDEIDKVGADYKGDPAAALLEVLDPEQNKEFTDHFLDVPFDLSKVLFITTANTTETIPRPLLDRMEVVEVSGYTEEEKVKIALEYILPKQVEAHGLKKSQIKVGEPAIRDIINYYTRESGVRNMEREITKVCRKAAKKIVSEERKTVTVTPKNLTDLLGKHRFLYDKIEKEPEVGMVTGMAWTSVGGETLPVETAVMSGTGKLELTGQLGDVMQESAKAAYSYIRSKAEELGIEGQFYKDKDIHVHVPEGAIPKDGPSAGVTMCTSMVSSLTNRAVRNDLAMTGEITLRGKVLAVGGIKEKVLAAHRAGIRTIILPKENERDIDDIPENVRAELTFIPVEKIDEVLREAFV